MPPKIDLERLLRLRTVVARFGELDVARWWNSNGQLGRLGAVVLRRGFSRTYRFAQARSVFAAGAVSPAMSSGSSRWTGPGRSCCATRNASRTIEGMVTGL